MARVLKNKDLITIFMVLETGKDKLNPNNFFPFGNRILMSLDLSLRNKKGFYRQDYGTAALTSFQTLRTNIVVGKPKQLPVTMIKECCCDEGEKSYSKKLVQKRRVEFTNTSSRN